MLSTSSSTDVTQPDNNKDSADSFAEDNSSSVDLADNSKIQTGSLSVAVAAVVLIACAAVIYFLQKKKKSKLIY